MTVLPVSYDLHMNLLEGMHMDPTFSYLYKPLNLEPNIILELNLSSKALHQPQPSKVYL